ncbi:hypothetical protein RRG08_039627 [Elysia crispata]|uniref:Uncharacterized protein n=1 Tax=Elysia crispata TaxID=231223 RepID=A0AAE0YBH5_9GAST|nr:hypothetical protein RRG08_039627 [Elysia crispata]
MQKPFKAVAEVPLVQTSSGPRPLFFLTHAAQGSGISPRCDSSFEREAKRYQQRSSLGIKYGPESRGDLAFFQPNRRAIVTSTKPDNEKQFYSYVMRWKIKSDGVLSCYPICGTDIAADSGQFRQSLESHLTSFFVRSDSHTRVTSRASWSGQTVTRESPRELLGQVRQSLEGHLTNFLVRSDSHSRVTSRTSLSGQTVTRESPHELLGQVRQSLESHLTSFLVRSDSHSRVTSRASWSGHTVTRGSPRELLGQVRQSWRHNVINDRTLFDEAFYLLGSVARAPATGNDIRQMFALDLEHCYRNSEGTCVHQTVRILTKGRALRHTLRVVYIVTGGRCAQFNVRVVIKVRAILTVFFAQKAFSVSNRRVGRTVTIRSISQTGTSEGPERKRAMRLMSPLEAVARLWPVVLTLELTLQIGLWC